MKSLLADTGQITPGNPVFLWHLDPQCYRDEQPPTQTSQQQNSRQAKWVNPVRHRKSHLSGFHDWWKCGCRQIFLYHQEICSVREWLTASGTQPQCWKPIACGGRGGKLDGSDAATLSTTHCQQKRLSGLWLPHALVKRICTNFHMVSANFLKVQILKVEIKYLGRLYSTCMQSVLNFLSLNFLSIPSFYK